ncbi:MAG TPA: non-homologous end-joining DNA ligase [Acidimicrobiia bacterium]|nr:non-homologous end-joining DNA ligase [Acidimicrobiia bacterium]
MTIRPSPGRYQPMLATPWAKAFSDPGWWFEVKWDGYRTIAYCGSARTELRSRRGNDVGYRFPEVAAMRLEANVVLDGEVVAFDDGGTPSFFLLGQRPANFIAFDLLYQDGDRCDLPYEARRELLGQLDLPKPAVISQPVLGEGEALFEAVGERGMEGIVAKKAGSLYYPGRRSPDWRKVAHKHRGKAVVGGFLAGEGARAVTFGSLLLGLWAPDGLRFIGSIGSGLTDRTLREVGVLLNPLRRKDSPFVNVVDVPGHKSFVDPVLVVEIEYRQWTPYDRLRAPVFKGLAGDVPSDSVTWASDGPTSSTAGG